MGAAVSNTIMGVSIVFFVLVSLSFLIYLFRFISVIEDKLTKKKTSEPVKEEKVQEIFILNLCKIKSESSNLQRIIPRAVISNTVCNA